MRHETMSPGAGESSTTKEKREQWLLVKREKGGHRGHRGTRGQRERSREKEKERERAARDSSSRNNP